VRDHLLRAMVHNMTLLADNAGHYYDIILSADNFSPCVRCQNCRLKSCKFSLIVMKVANDVIMYILWIVYLFLMSACCFCQPVVLGRPVWYGM